MYKTKNVAIYLSILISACSFALGTGSNVIAESININNTTATIPITEISNPTTAPITGGNDTTPVPPQSTGENPVTLVTIPVTTISPNVTTGAPNVTTVSPNVTTISPNVTTISPNVTTISPNVTTISPNVTTVSPNVTTIAPNVTTIAPNSTTPVPVTTVKPTVAPPTTPVPSHRRFDGPSFIGGIVLALGLVAIGFVAFKFYKARTELNYHTL